MEVLELTQEIGNYLSSKKAEDILLIDVREKTALCDYFVIASGRNPNHVKSLYDELEVKMEDLGFPLVRSEGYNEGRWIVMDFSVIIVHLFYEPEREFYHLERLWDDGRNRVPYEKKA